MAPDGQQSLSASQGEQKGPFDELFDDFEKEAKAEEEKRREALIAEGKDPDEELEEDPEAPDDGEGVDTLTKEAVVDDVSFAFAKKEYEWLIPTGQYNAAGQPVSVKVMVKDPGDPDLPLKFVFALNKDANRAEEALWRACVKTPIALTEKGAPAKCTSVFRSTLTNRLRLLVGINRDFLESLSEMLGTGPRGRRLRKKSLAKSPLSTDGTPEKSTSDSTGSGSSTPTPSLAESEKSSEPDSSLTSPTSSVRPLPRSPRRFATPTSPSTPPSGPPVTRSA